MYPPSYQSLVWKPRHQYQSNAHCLGNRAGDHVWKTRRPYHCSSEQCSLPGDTKLYKTSLQSIRWPVNAIQFGQLVRTNVATYENMFLHSENTADVRTADGSDDEDVPMMADELGLGADEVIPFPNELHMSFGEEMMNVFEADVLILVNPGTGQMLKGVLALHRWAICVCKTVTQKNLIHAELQNWVKTMHLVSFADKPAKPQDLVK